MLIPTLFSTYKIISTCRGIFDADPISKLLNDYGDICRKNNATPKKVILTFAPCGRPKTMTFIKWLGMNVRF